MLKSDSLAISSSDKLAIPQMWQVGYFCNVNYSGFREGFVGTA